MTQPADDLQTLLIGAVPNLRAFANSLCGDPTRADEHFFNGSVQWNFTTASSLRLFAGGTRGGLRCISGVCREFPPFTGALLELVVRL